MGTSLALRFQPRAIDAGRLNDVLSRLYSKRGVRVIGEIRKAFALSGSEFARLFGVSAEAARKWERDGVPPARLPDLYHCFDLVKTLLVQHERARLPAVVRSPIADSHGRTLLQMIGDEGLSAVLEFVKKKPQICDVSVPDLAASIALLRKDRQALNTAGVHRAALFGSVARGEARSNSDIDVLVELNPDAHVGLVQFVDLQEHLRALFQRDVDVVSLRALHPARDAAILAEAVYAF
jgi:hypothetical protein